MDRPAIFAADFFKPDRLLGAGLMSASGSTDVDASDNLSGRFTVDLKAPSRQMRANLVLSGTLRAPRFNR